MSEQKKSWWNIKAQSEKDEAEVYIYDEIGGWGVTASGFLSELKALNVSTIHLHLNSPGGSVFDGVAIYNLLRSHKARVITHVDGLAASIASIIALAGDEVHMAHNALFMIHNPWTMTWGDADDLRKDADTLDKIRDTLVSTYALKTGMTDEQIIEMMDEETWLDATEASEMGFVDTIYDGLEVAAKIDLSRFDADAIQAKVDSVRNGKMDTQKTTDTQSKPDANADFSAKLELIEAALQAKLDEATSKIGDLSDALNKAIAAGDAMAEKIKALEDRPSASAEVLKIVAATGAQPIDHQETTPMGDNEKLSDQLAQIKDPSERAKFIKENRNALWKEARESNK